MDDREQGALDLISEYGEIDGAHHKQWLLDQVVRMLTGNEYEYDRWVESHLKETEYQWDEGVAP